MDPIHRGPDESGHDAAAEDARPAHPAALPERAAPAPARARVTRIVSGGLLLTVNPVDGSEIEPCPPGEEPPAARRRTPEERAEAARAAAVPAPPGPAAPELPLLERDEQRARLTETLTRGRSARLTGPDGSGRTALLDAVADDCAALAPDGVVRLSGRHRTTPGELLHELRAAVLHAPHHRPDRDGLRDSLAGVGAVVVVDDLEFGGAALDELLAAAPECAFLLAAAPGVPVPSAEAQIEEVALPGLGRAASLALLEAAVGRRLTDEEANWAGDLWFESEGLPLRFVQAGALLRQRDRLRVTPAEFDAFGALEEAFGPSGTAPAAGPADAAPGPDPYEDPDIEVHEVPLPSLGEGAAPAALLASRLSRSAQTTLRFAVALGGEVPHHAHLPALVGDTHADAALGELRACGLLTPAGTRHRLAGGVLTQLLAHGYGHDAADRVHAAAQHYAWWAGHPSVGPERAAAESDALLAALAALLADTAGGTEAEAERRTTAVALARAAAPAFAAGLHWSAWERALRSGQEAARLAGEVAEEAYFHHELGVLAICAGNLARARAELEASIGLRGVLADKRGTVAGRRALALVADLGREREPAPAPARADSPARGLPAVRAAAPAPAEPPTELLPPVPAPAAVVPPAFPDFPDFKDFAGEGPTVVGRSATVPAPADPAPRRGLAAGILDGTRRNLAAVGAGALLVAVLGTVVTLGATSGNDDAPASGTVSTDSTADQGGAEDPGTDDGAPAEGGESGDPAATGTPTASGSPGPTTSGATPTATGTDATATGSPSTGAPDSTDPSSSAPGTTTAPPTTSPRPTSTGPVPTRTTTRPPTSPTGTIKPPTTPPTTPTTTPPPTPTTTPPTTEATPPTDGDPGGTASATLDGAPTASETPVS
ncbi:ATPase AAA [Streptomyces sp. NE5-10]|uniref:ATP-binding protein n=1 Tax=Streptomyces sp. NE5-10 TaxID=2759674 RepID=UPI001906984F|nr:ATP-binding protein [Streptomyces sp. NE5-10]GHJ95045.1 ATPase AAA [Streptomyces sp. NE5-10]